MSALPDPQSSITTGQVLIAALARQAWDEIAACLDEAVRFRALIPRGLREAADRAGAAVYFQQWFGDADVLTLMDSEVVPMQDRLYITYRFRAHEDKWYVVEQHAYCIMEAGQIKQIDLLCSGFRPEAPPANQANGK